MVKNWIIICLLGILCFGFANQGQIKDKIKAKVVEAECIRLVDPEGKTTCFVGTVGKEGPGVYLYGHDGQARAILRLNHLGRPTLIFGDADGKMIMECGLWGKYDIKMRVCEGRPLRSRWIFD